MPIIKFQCLSCGLLLSKRTARTTQSVKCDCGVEAFQKNTGGVSVGFNSSVDGSLKVQDTGMDSFDLDFDRVIGEDARQKWEQIYQRRRDKWDLMHKHNALGKDLIRMEDQTYEVLPEMGDTLRTSRVTAMDIIKTKEPNAGE